MMIGMRVYAWSGMVRACGCCVPEGHGKWKTLCSLFRVTWNKDGPRLPFGKHRHHAINKWVAKGSIEIILFHYTQEKILLHTERSFQDIVIRTLEGMLVPIVVFLT